MPLTSVATPTLPGQRVKAREPLAKPDRRRRGPDAAIALAYLCVGFVVMVGLWADPGDRAVAKNGPDQVFFEWILGYAAHAVTHGTNPWFTSLMNAPLGVNVAANTAVTLIGVALTPVTLIFGASVSFVLALTLNLAGTAFAWYWLFSRHVTRTRAGAIAGGAFCGFAPGLISHANGHLNFTAQFLIPLLLWRLVLIARRTRSGAATGPARRAYMRRDGVILGLLIAAQYAIGAEMLFFTALGAGIFAVAWLVQRPEAAWRLTRRVVPPLALAAAVAAALLAYPMWMQFFGPQTYQGTGFGNIGAASDLLSFGALPYLSIGGALGGWRPLAVNVGEENAYFGPVLFLALIWLAVLVWRGRLNPARFTRGSIGLTEARALITTAVVIAVASLGSPLWVAHHKLPVPMVWGLVSHLPVFNAALPGRFALLLIPIVALVLAVTLDTLVQTRRRPRALIAVGLVALVPIVPLPIPTASRAPIPLFFSSGDWRAYVVQGQSVLPVPPATPNTLDGQRWQTATDFAFAIPGGYFLGPSASGRSTTGSIPRYTDTTLHDVAMTGVLPVITPADRDQAAIDLAYWHTGLIVLPDEAAGSGDTWAAHHDELYEVCTALFGAPQRVDDVWLWYPAGE